MTMRRHPRSLISLVGIVTAGLVLSGCGASGDPLDPSTGGGDAADTVVIGSQAYYSNEIIAEIYAQVLEGAGYSVERKFSIGQRDAYIPELESGAIDLFPEYTGNLLEYYDPDTSATSPSDVYQALQRALPEGLTALAYADATDQDTYTVTKAFADEHGLVEIADLAKVPTPVTIGAAPEFEQRPYGPAAARQLYGVELIFSATGPTTLESLLRGTIQVADIYTADPAFQTEQLVALADPENMILSSNVVPIVSSELAGEIGSLIDAVSAALSADELVALNVMSSVDQRSTADIAKEWIAAKKLG